MPDVKMSEMDADDAVGGSEKLLALDVTDSKTITTDQMAAYAVDTLLSAAAADPTTGDNLVAERSGTEKLLDLDALAVYCVASGWSEASEADPVVAGDMILVDRSGTIYEIDVDTLATYVQDPTSTLNGVASLDEATLAAADEYLVVQSGVAKKTDIEDIQAQMWTAYGLYVAALDDIATLADADVLYVLEDGSTAKYATMTELATYMLAEIGESVAALVWDDAAAVTSVADADVFVKEESGVRKKVNASYIGAYAISELFGSTALTPPVVDSDDMVLYRSGAAYVADADDFASYVLNEAWGLDAAGALADANTLMVGQSDVAKEVALSVVKTYVLDGMQDTALDVSGLSGAAPLAAGDKYLAWQADVAVYTTLGTIETKLWTDFATYVNATLVDISSLAAADRFYVLDAGTDPKYCTAAEIAAYVAGPLFDLADAGAIVGTDKLLMETAGTPKTLLGSDLLTYIEGGIDAANLDFDISGFDSAVLDNAHLLFVSDGATEEKATVAELEAVLWADFRTYTVGLGAVVTVADTDKFWVDQGGTAKYVTPVELATYVESAIEATVIATAFDAADATNFLAADLILTERSGTPHTATASDVATYVVGVLGGSGAGTPTTGDDFLFFHSGDPNLGDIDELADYVIGKAFDNADPDPIASGDLLAVERSGTAYTADIDIIQTYILSGLQDTALDIATIDAAGGLSTADKYLVWQSDVEKYTTLSAIETKLWTDYATYVHALSDIVTLADADEFYVLDAGTTAKNGTVLEVYTYVLGKFWAAAASDPIVTADTLLIDHSGTMKEATVDQLQTFVLDGIQADVLDISGLDSATVDGADLVVVCEGSTGKKATVTELAAGIFGTFDTYVAGLDPVDPVEDADKIYIVEGGVGKYVTPVVLMEYAWAAVTAKIQGLAAKTTPTENDILLIQDEANGDALKELTIGNLWDNLLADSALNVPWATIATSKYTALPASTSTITMSDTSDMAVGRALRYTYDSVTYYGIITAVTEDTSITIAGAALNVAIQLSALAIGLPSLIEQVEFFVEAAWGDAVEDILAEIGKKNFKWGKSIAHLVAFSAANHTVDTGAEPKLNVKVAGSAVSTNDSNNGVQLGAADTWVDNPAIAISAANYTIERGDALELACTVVGGTGDATGLTVSCVFVYE